MRSFLCFVLAATTIGCYRWQPLATLDNTSVLALEDHRIRATVDDQPVELEHVHVETETGVVTGQLGGPNAGTGPDLEVPVNRLSSVSVFRVHRVRTAVVAIGAGLPTAVISSFLVVLLAQAIFPPRPVTFTPGPFPTR